ncbi:MAG TPA: ATP synthase F1 subunit delta [Firmicutes bacterium]|nr:ATP synthase F1 subunit delta [Bacillota bacterium]
MLQAVAKRYASALFEIALERGILESFDDQAYMLEVVFSDSLVKNFFGSPRISDSEKKAALDKQFTDRVEQPLLHLLKLLVDKRRILYVVPIMRYFDHLTDVHRGVEEATVVSAVELSEAQRDEIVAELKRFSEYGQLRIKTEVDRGVIGGVKVQLGDHLVLDGTVSSRLNEMREQLTQFMHRGTGA